MCAPHTGIGSDGVLLLSESGDDRFVAEVRIFNPDGSEAELSGNGVREAVMYLRYSGWTDEDSFSVKTAAGEIRPRIEGELCTMELGQVRLRAEADFPSGGDDGIGTLASAGRDFDFQFVQVGNPQASIEVREGLEELELTRFGPEIESHELFPNRTNVSFWCRAAARSARASSSAAWGRRCHPAPAPTGAAVGRGAARREEPGDGHARRRRARGGREREPGD